MKFFDPATAGVGNRRQREDGYRRRESFDPRKSLDADEAA